MIPVGLALQPDDEMLELMAPVIRDAQLYEVTPETLWVATPDGSLGPNGFHRRFRLLADKTRRPFVAHGVGLSLGTSWTGDAGRRARWLARVRADHAAFRFRWYTEHLGASALAGLAMQLPVPLPMTAASASVVRRRLRSMQRVVPRVGVENNVAYFTLGAPLEEPAFLRRILVGKATHLLLDLHNVYTMAVNYDFEPEAYLRQLDLNKVIEIHLSGGLWSDPRWLASGRRFRLDGHDSAVPEAVWRLFESVGPRCPRLRAVVLERMEGTVRPGQVPGLREELARARRMARRWG